MGVRGDSCRVLCCCQDEDVVVLLWLCWLLSLDSFCASAQVSTKNKGGVHGPTTTPQRRTETQVTDDDFWR